MIRNFEEFTDELNEYERKVLLPIMVECFKKHVGEENAITCGEIISKMTAKGYQISGVRIRKIVNVIRRYDLVHCLVSSAKGYFVADNIEQVSDCIDSLQGREDAIRVIKEALIAQREVMRKQIEKRQPAA